MRQPRSRGPFSLVNGASHEKWRHDCWPRVISGHRPAPTGAPDSLAGQFIRHSTQLEHWDLPRDVREGLGRPPDGPHCSHELACQMIDSALYYVL